NSVAVVGDASNTAPTSEPGSTPGDDTHDPTSGPGPPPEFLAPTTCYRQPRRGGWCRPGFSPWGSCPRSCERIAVRPNPVALRRWPPAVTEPSSGWVVVGGGGVGRAPSGRVRRWVRDTVGPPVGVGLGGGPAIPGAGCGRRCR